MNRAARCDDLTGDHIQPAAKMVDSDGAVRGLGSGRLHLYVKLSFIGKRVDG